MPNTNNYQPQQVDLNTLSDEELNNLLAQRKAAMEVEQQQQPPTQAPVADLSSMSDEELNNLLASHPNAPKAPTSQQQQQGGAVSNFLGKAGEVVGGIADGIKQMGPKAEALGRGILTAPVELASGATRLISPGTADSIDRGLSKFNNFMSQNADAVSGQPTTPESDAAKKNLYNIGNSLPTLTVGGMGAIANTARGALAGLMSAGEGESTKDVLARMGMGGVVGGAIGTAGRIAGKATEMATNVASASLDTVFKNHATQKISEAAINTLHKSGKLGQVLSEAGGSLTKVMEEIRAASQALVSTAATTGSALATNDLSKIDSKKNTKNRGY